MTHDDIIRMAREAGLPKRLPEFYARCFEKLIVAAYTQGRDDERATAYEAPPDVLAEREACAKVCDDLVLHQYSASGCAAAIRARGQA
jgi:hypothetical protein